MPPAILLRPAVLADIPTLTAWDEEPHVQFSDPNMGSGWDWEDEIEASWPGYWHFIAEVQSTPIGFVQIIDPEIEHSQYWGAMGPGYRAIDIWIGPADWLGIGCGTQMLQQALEYCFSDTTVHTVLIDPIEKNIRAHRFYQRCGFQPTGLRQFGADTCLVHELKRADWRIGDTDA